MTSRFNEKGKGLCYLIKVTLLLAMMSHFNLCIAGDLEQSQSFYDIKEPKTITLSEGLRLATEQNRIIKIALQSSDVAYTDILIARSKLFPAIDAYASQTFLAHQPAARFGTVEVPTDQKESYS